METISRLKSRLSSPPVVTPNLFSLPSLNTSHLPSSSTSRMITAPPRGFMLLTTGQIFNKLTSKSDPLVRPPNDAPELAQLQFKAITSLKSVWATSTWKNRTDLNARLMEFRQRHNLMEDHPLVLDWAILLFVESTNTLPSSRRTYISQLAALYRRQGMDLPLCSLQVTALRATSMIPMHQAVAATPSQVDRLLLRSGVEDPRLQAAIFILWKTASRWDDVLNLTGASFLLLSPSELVVEWLNKTKSTRTDPWRMSSWTVIHHEAPMTPYLPALSQLRPEEPLVEMTTAQFVSWLAKDKDPQVKDLTAHSFKSSRARGQGASDSSASSRETQTPGLRRTGYIN